MNPLPPLPFVKAKDGSLAFLIDNSTLETLVCPRLYELKHLRQRDLVAARAGRNFGACLHVGWKERYLRCGSSAVDAANEPLINEAMAAYLLDKPQPPDDFRTLEHAQRVMSAYNSRYRDEPFKVLPKADGSPAVESSFAFPLGIVRYPAMNELADYYGVKASVPIPINVNYTGRIDLQTHDVEGDWSGPDHKTAFQFGKGFTDKMATDSAQRGYCWAFQQFYGHLPRGYIIDAVRIRRPSKADTYAGVAPIDASDFQRIPFYIFPDDIEEWKQDTLAKVETIFWMHSRGYFQKHTRRCVTEYGRCDMYDVCIAARGTRDEVLSSNLYEPATWSPLNAPKPFDPVQEVIDVMVNPPKI